MKLSVVTEMVFESKEELFKYLNSDRQAKITGFSSECKQAFQIRPKPFVVQTERPQHGAIVSSYIKVEE